MTLQTFGSEDVATASSGIVNTTREFQPTSPSSMSRIRLVTVEGERQTPRRPTIQAYGEYLTGIGLAERTIRKYSWDIERFWKYAESEAFDPFAVGALDLRLFTETMPDSSKRTARSALKHWFESIGYMDAPMRAMRVPRKKRGISRALEPEEASRLAHCAVAMEHPGGMAVLLGLYLGLRREEISQTQWPRFDPEFEWYTVLGKGGVEATVPVHPVVREVLRPRMTAFPAVFPGLSATHVAPGTIAMWVANVGKEAEVKNLAPHRLRHTAIATINDNTGDLRMAQEFARHADIETTQIYTRVTKDRLRSAVDALTYLDDQPTALLGDLPESVNG